MGSSSCANCAKCIGGTKPKVVFCTTENDVAHIARAMHAGADEYIMKPFDKQIVQSKLEGMGPSDVRLADRLPASSSSSGGLVNATGGC